MQGKINVQSENIFPIIKKFLYSDHEIFLRELVSNAVDATQKLKTLSRSGEAKGDLGELDIEVVLNTEKKQLRIIDKGIGLDADEVEKYINQIAFSGAEEFLEKYKDQNEAKSIIGHFGLGFYSAFMVSDKVEILSKSYREDAKAIHWECEGDPEYKLEESDKTERGTEIVLHINEDSAEFLEAPRIQELLNKYCKFLPVTIRFEGKEINNTSPAWTKKPADLKDEDYNAFYKELYPFADDPLFNIHLNVDYPFNLTGILYFPKIKSNIEIQKNKIQLYCNQVFVTDSVEGIVPDFLTLLHGVIDSPDIPLNVSRSYLQSDANVKKISSHISKKVADRLEELFKEDRKNFEEKWDDINVFIKYGMLSDEKFFDRAQKFFLFKNTDEKFFTIDEYKDLISANQTDKEDKVVHLYASNKETQHSFIQGAKERAFDVLLFDGPLDSHLLNLLEQKIENSSFARVDADTLDNLIRKDEIKESALSEQEQNDLKPVIEETINNKMFEVSFETMSADDPPMMVTQPEFMRRMKEMTMASGGGIMGEVPDQYRLLVNTNHPIIKTISETKTAKKKEKLIKQTADLALLSQNMLSGQDLADFIKRSLDILK